MQKLRCACGIDAHAHVVPENFPAYVGASCRATGRRWRPRTACHRNVMISGKVYRTVSDSAGTRQAAGRPAGHGPALQVVSPMPELLSYWMAPADAQQLLRYLNDQIAAMVQDSGGRLAALGAVPLQDMDMAIAELEYAVRTLGFAGVEIGSNINGVPVGAPQLDPFFEACEALGAAVFVHALRPAGMERLVGPRRCSRCWAIRATSAWPPRRPSPAT
jgi:aminocarboxymuconate-semialdehyde decarboxylase